MIQLHGDESQITADAGRRVVEKVQHENRRLAHLIGRKRWTKSSIPKCNKRLLAFTQNSRLQPSASETDGNIRAKFDN